MVALDFLGERPFVHFGRAVIDPEGADFAEHLFDHRVGRHARATHHLDTPVRDSHQRLAHRHLGHRAFGCSQRPAVQHVSAPIDHHLRLFHVDQVLGQHEADALMVDQRLAEGVPRAGIGGGDFLRARHGAEPAHAMRQARRAEADLSILEALAAAAEHLVGADAEIVDGHDSMTARHRGVDRVEQTFDTDRRVRQVDEEHARAIVGLGHDDANSSSLCARDEGLATVDHPVIAIETAGRAHHRRIGSRPAL